MERKVNETILVASSIWGSASEQEFLINEIIKPFEKETGYVVNFQSMADDVMLDQAEVQYASDHVTVDVVIVDNYQIGEWIDAGLVQDVSEMGSGMEDRQFVSSFSEITDRGEPAIFPPSERGCVFDGGQQKGIGLSANRCTIERSKLGGICSMVG